MDLVSSGSAVEAPFDLNKAFQFHLSWSSDRVDRFIKSSFPIMFQYMKETFSPSADGKQWRLLIRQGNKNTLVLYPRYDVRGNDLSTAWARGRTWDQTKIYIGTSFFINSIAF